MLKAGSMRRVAVLLSVLTIALSVAYVATCWYLVSAMVTFPRKDPGGPPAELHVPAVETLSFTTADGIQLRGWYLPSLNKHAIVLVHGIYSNAWDCQAPDLVRAYADGGFAVLLYDSRGQGTSEGVLGLAWLEREDVRAAVALLLARGFPAGAIGVHGTSYGAATALLATARVPEVGAVVADSAFADVHDVMLGELTRRTGVSGYWARFLSPGLGLMVRRRLGVNLYEAAPVNAIAAISPRPVLLIHGDRDPIVPVDALERLRAAAGPGTESWILAGRQHTEGVRLADCETPSPVQRAFLSRVVGFFEQHLVATPDEAP